MKTQALQALSGEFAAGFSAAGAGREQREWKKKVPYAIKEV